MLERLRARSGYDFILISDPKELTVERLSSIKPRFVFFPHWSAKIDKNIHEGFECVIFHMTDLPFGRGGSPLQNLIARGIYETKISALRCVEEMDAGPIYLKKPFSLYGAAGEIFLRASNVIEEMIVEILETLPEPSLQEGEPTIFRRRRPEEGNLARAQSLNQVFDLVRMLDADGYPHAFIEIGSFRMEFTRASAKFEQVIADVRITYVGDNEERDKQ